MVACGRVVLLLAVLTQASAHVEQLDTSMSGYLPCNDTSGASLFYWGFRHSASSPGHEHGSIPLVVWLQGGPGASGLIGLFFEVGPYTISPDRDRGASTFAVEPNEWSWSKAAHIVFVDQPIGTGFSTARTDNDYVKSEAEAAEQLTTFLKHLYQRYDWLDGSPLFLAGESYAGKYIPQTAHAIMQYNSVASSSFLPTLPLRGLLIGDGLVDPLPQLLTGPALFESLGLLDRRQAREAISDFAPCVKAVGAGDFADAFGLCFGQWNSMDDEAGDPYDYDVRVAGSPDPFAAMFAALRNLLTNESLRHSLGVGNRTWVSMDGTDPHNPVTAHMVQDFVAPTVAPLLGPILDAGIRVHFYAGQFDVSPCNHLGLVEFLERLEWHGQADFAASRRRRWAIDGVNVGFVRSGGGLSWTLVERAGHLVPHDAPHAAYDLLQSFLRGD